MGLGASGEKFFILRITHRGTVKSWPVGIRGITLFDVFLSIENVPGRGGKRCNYFLLMTLRRKKGVCITFGSLFCRWGVILTGLVRFWVAVRR